MEMLPKFTFSTGQEAYAIILNEAQDNRAALRSIGLYDQRPTLVIIGGASNMNSESYTALAPIFVDVLAPLAEEFGLYVIDGGTDAGVIQMMGQARGAIAGTFALIGIAPEGKVMFPHMSYPDDSQHQRKELEPNHTHFVLAPGTEWGDESPWIARVATLLSGEAPSIALLINGGKIAFTDLKENIDCGRSAVILEGSGRLADDIARSLRKEYSESNRAINDWVYTLPHNQLIVTNLSNPHHALKNLLRQYLVPSILNR